MAFEIVAFDFPDAFAAAPKVYTKRVHLRSGSMSKRVYLFLFRRGKRKKVREGAAMQVNIAEAKAKLSELIAAAEKGEEVIIARGGQPAVRLVSVHRPTVRIGIGDGLVSRVPDFLAPMSEDELRDWE